ncbi:DnaJ-domain-containing protein [Hesseltinella vesiculosa]|uniref:DnaJ-domain-containing protein n=1 Tax=Hesseltinella vesiculosa TaxID=101127 RepID=A0A1X2GJS9_9FUNG|nr:DnaJ-domain-containing protein [Hesseltinella vesiculosa]
MLKGKGFLYLFALCWFILSVILPQVHAWDKHDFEIFDLVDELESIEGKGTNFYSWLDLKPSASQADVGRAYRKKSLKMHPDKNKHDPKAQERFARLGKVAAILRNKSKRERYNFFYKNGVPRWRGTGYYYSRFRPGVGTAVVILILVGTGMQALAQKINASQEKKRILHFVQDARHNLTLNVPKSQGAPTLGTSYLEIGGRAMRCEVKSDHYIIVHPESKDDEPIHLNSEWVYQPTWKDLFIIRLPQSIIQKLLGKPQDASPEDDTLTDDDSSDHESSFKSLLKTKKPKVKQPPTQVTGTKVGGRRRAVKK